MLILCDLRFLDCLTVMSSEIGLSSVAFPRWFGGLWRVCGGVAVAGSVEHGQDWSRVLCEFLPGVSDLTWATIQARQRVLAWTRFGNQGVIAENDPAEQEKSVKWNSLLCNLIVFHTAIDMMEVIRQLVAEGWQVTAEDLAQLSPYLRSRADITLS